MIVRLRVPKRPLETELEEEKVPFGGVIRGDEADTSATKVGESDKVGFEMSKRTAETKMGGPLPGPAREGSVVPGSPAPVASPGPGGKAMPAQAIRPLRDWLLHNLSDFSPTPGPSTPHHHPSPPGPGLGGNAGGKLEKINKIRFGTYDIDTWYTAPYPEEYAYVPDGRL